MPSAANVKMDKQAGSETSGAPASSEVASSAAVSGSANPAPGGPATPIRQAITIIEHKIRNMEKRKSKLESYRELQNSGKDLNHDQKTAVAKYDEVVQTLEFARDLCKQFVGIANASEKEAKKQARKEALVKSQSELAKIREVLLVQDALNQMGPDNVRQDFLLGRNSAALLTENDLNLLDELYPAVTPKHESGNPTAFTSQVQAAAEHLLAVVDGKQKEGFGGTYAQIKEVIGKVHESGYLDQATNTEYDELVTSEDPERQNCGDICIAGPEPIQAIAEIRPNLETIPLVEPIIASPHQDMSLRGPVEQLAADPQPIFYQQAPPPPRPITEVLGTPSFQFIQDSELDTPDTLPSQTYTNANYPQGPPPLALPPNFHHQPFQPSQQPPAVVPVVAANIVTTNGNTIEDVVVPLQQQHIQSGGQIDDNVHHKHRNTAAQGRHGGSHHNNANHQPFYQNNNHFNGNHRGGAQPRQHRNNQSNNGPRPPVNRQH